jgi:hypothetical protein
MEAILGYTIIGILSLLLGFVIGLNFDRWGQKEPPMFEDYIYDQPSTNLKSHKENWERDLDNEYKASIIDREPLKHPFPSDFELKKGDNVRLTHPLHCMDEDGQLVSIPVGTVCIVDNLWYDDQYANKKAVKIYIPVVKQHHVVDLSFLGEE